VRLSDVPGGQTVEQHAHAAALQKPASFSSGSAISGLLYLPINPIVRNFIDMGCDCNGSAHALSRMIMRSAHDRTLEAPAMTG
jgi:hypothetical protein